MSRQAPHAGATVAWHVYLIRRGDGALYAGITTDVQRRLAEHSAGGTRAARALRGRGPLAVVYATRVGPRGTALRAEHRIKRLGKQDKEALVRRQPGPLALLRGLGLRLSGKL